MTPEFTPWVRDVLPPGSDVAIVEHAGHFLQLEQPDAVGRRIVDFLGRYFFLRPGWLRASSGSSRPRGVR